MQNHDVIDLRSDTVTRPSPAMREAMAKAEVGDDVFGEDPTIRILESEVAKLLGKEAALYVSSGTQANQLALALHTRPGDSVLAEDDVHCFIFEAGGAAALSGIQFDFLGPSGTWKAEDIPAKVRPDNLHSSPTKVFVVENTHNRAGGNALSPEFVGMATATAKKNGLKTHCDGARLWNAAVAFGVPEASLAAGFDTLSVCFSKGLGAPVGSALVGTAEFIERAKKVRKRWGGGMRQAGIIAAGALFALKNNRSLLQHDHAKIVQLREQLEGHQAREQILVKACDKPTNILYFQVLRKDPEAFVKALWDMGVRLIHVGGGWVRVVTHLDISPSAFEKATEVITTALKAP